MKCIFLILLTAHISQQAVVNTHDITAQMTYQCPSDVELSCVALWIIRPRHGLLGNGEKIYSLQCEETPPLSPNCALPDSFTFNETKLIKPAKMRDTYVNLASYRGLGEFAKIGCKPTQTAICLGLNGAAYKMQGKHIMLKLRCKDVLEKGCRVSENVAGEKFVAIMPYAI